LPGEASLEEIDEDEAKALEVVSSTLLDSYMGVETGIPGCSGEALAIFIGNVLARFWVLVSLGQTEVYGVHVMLSLANSH